jgi:phosphosulfolactate synthase (CoM biosynthesis protein A)
MLSDYFTYINRQVDDGDTFQVYEKTTSLMEKFCAENNLQVKAIKEVHYLCLQLERLIFEATKNEQKSAFKSLFTGVAIPHPTEDQEKLLQ